MVMNLKHTSTYGDDTAYDIFLISKGKGEPLDKVGEVYGNDMRSAEWVARLFCLAPDMLDIIRRLAMYKPEICPFCYEVKGMHTETCIVFLATRIIDIVDKSYKQEEE